MTRTPSCQDDLQALVVVVFLCQTCLAAAARPTPPLSLSDSKCSGDIQPDGYATFTFSVRDHCNFDIRIQGIISGEVNGSRKDWIPPVLVVSTESFTINYNQSLELPSVEIDLHCSHSHVSGLGDILHVQEPRLRISCPYDDSMNSAKIQIPTIEPPTAEHSLPRTPDNSPRYRVGVIASVVVVVIVLCGTFAWIVVHRRNSMEKEDVECPLSDSSAETSASSSTEKLQDPQGPPEAAPIKGHNEHRGT